MIAANEFRFIMHCVNLHATNKMLVNCNSILGHQTTNLILSLRDTIGPFNWAIMCMNIRYLIM